jgi:choice-of-anchor B domain-containing protein
MKNIIFSIFLFTSLFSYAQLENLSNLTYDTRLNDIWGYEDEKGNSYALVGLLDGVSIVNVTNPNLPVEVYRKKSVESIWRDLKVYKDFLYVTNESDSGIEIFDLSGLPESNIIPSVNFKGAFEKAFSSAHNLFIDEQGYCYVVGADRGNGGMIVYDLNENPTSPKEIGFYNDHYIHDVYVRNDTAYTADISENRFSILDVSDLNHITRLGSAETKDGITHNTCLSKNGNTLYTSDELNGGEIGAYDVSSTNNIERVGGFKSRFGGDEMPHNVLVKDSLLFISYYKEGLIVVDATIPSNLIELDRFDSNKDLSGPGSGGNWGVYPYLSNGLILISDVQKGLFVLDYTKEKASFVFGTIKDLETGYPLNSVNVFGIGNSMNSESDFSGSFETGLNEIGLKQLVFHKSGYQSDTVNVELLKGEIVTLNVFLKPIPKVNFKLNIKDVFGQKLSNISVAIQGINYLKSFKTDTKDGLLIPDLFEGYFSIYVGGWGYINNCFTEHLTQENNTFSIILLEGISDDFSVDQGWETSWEEGDGMWERVKPEASYSFGSTLQYDPEGDASAFDCGNFAFCTEINPLMSASSSTVDCKNSLISPEIIFPSNLDDATFSFKYWLGIDELGNDTLKIGLINKNDTIFKLLATVDTPTNEWVWSSFNLSDVFPNAESVRFIVEINDNLEPWNIVDAALDEFKVEFSTGGRELTNVCFEQTKLEIVVSCANKGVKLFDSKGRLVRFTNQKKLSIGGLKTGLYLLETNEFKSQKIIIR